MSSTLVVAILELVIICLLCFRVYGMVRKNAKLKLENLQQENYYQTAIKQNEVLRSYMDNQHMVWNIELSPKAIEDGLLKENMIILLNGQELTEIWKGRFERGVEAGKHLGPVPVISDKNNVTRLNFPLDDKRFDGDYREHVNELTAIAVRFAGTQQLRSRLSSQVFNFRAYLKKRMSGELAKFPKESEQG